MRVRGIPVLTALLTIIVISRVSAEPGISPATSSYLLGPEDQLNIHIPEPQEIASGIQNRRAPEDMQRRYYGRYYAKSGRLPDRPQNVD